MLVRTFCEEVRRSHFGPRLLQYPRAVEDVINFSNPPPNPLPIGRGHLFSAPIKGYLTSLFIAKNKRPPLIRGGLG